MINIADKSYENVTNFRYSGKMATNQNYIHDEVKSKLNSGNAYNHSVHYL